MLIALDIKPRVKIGIIQLEKPSNPKGANHDYPVIQCFMILMTGIFIIVNLIIDVIYVYLNPKIKYGV